MAQSPLATASLGQPAMVQALMPQQLLDDEHRAAGKGKSIRSSTYGNVTVAVVAAHHAPH
jgi:hypothetical protein